MLLRAVDFLYGSEWSASAPGRASLNARACLCCALLIGCSGLLAQALDAWLGLQHVSAIFLPAVVICAIVWGMAASVLAVLLTLATTSFFFYAPVPNFRVEDPNELIDMAIFALVGIWISQMADFARKQAMAARRRADDMARLQRLSRRLADAADLQAIGGAIVAEASGNGSAALYLADTERLVLQAAAGTERPDDRQVQQRWQARQNGNRLDDAEGWRFHPLLQGSAALGILAIRDASRTGDAFLAALLDQAASAIQRGKLAAAMEDSRVEHRAQRLREAVVDAISHDLRTPLAAIVGAASTLEEFGALCGEAERKELLTSIREQGEKLDSSFAKLLDLSQIRAGNLLPKAESIDLTDIVQAALRHAAQSLRGFRLNVALPDSLPLLQMDPLMMQHAVDNLLENAAKYAPPGSAVRISAQQEGDSVVMEIADQGIGIAAADLERIFEPLYRAAQAMQAAHGMQANGINPKPPGKGLGLAIARAFVEANGGSLRAFSPGEGRGAIFRITLPGNAKPGGSHGDEA